MANFPGSLPSSSPATHQAVVEEIVAIAAQVRPGGTIQQIDDQVPVRVVKRKAEAEQTTDANMEEWRNADDLLVFYINEEGMPRVQNTRSNKTLFRIRNSGTNTNAWQLTNGDGTVTYFNVGPDGTVTAPNIGIPVRIATGAGQTGGILNAGQVPAAGNPAGVYLRRLA